MSSNIGRNLGAHLRRTRLYRATRLQVNRTICGSNNLYNKDHNNKDSSDNNVDTKIKLSKLIEKSVDQKLKEVVDRNDDDDEPAPDKYYMEAGRDVGKIFIRDDVQNILKSISRFDEGKLFSRRPVPKLESPKLMFMTQKQLEHAKEMAYESVRARTQSPPVMRPTINEDSTICYEPEIQGFMKNKVIFVDIGIKSTDRSRLMSVREPNGLLRYPTFNERSRMNYLFFPKKNRSIEVPKAFEKENMQKILDRGDYEYLLNRACLQFEPDDPRYIEICCTVYNYVDKMGHYDRLRSTRYFGQMSLFLAYYKRIDNLLMDMLKHEYIEDAADLVKLFYISNDIEESLESLEDLHIVKHYSDRYSFKKQQLQPAIQSTLNKLRKDRITNQ